MRQWEKISTRVVTDCTEVRCQTPSSLHLNGQLFSNYKNHTTLKGLIGISPGDAITFISQLYTGGISDREIVIRSGFLDMQKQDGDSVMADKGFTIEDLLPLGVSLNIPPFLGSSSQMPAQDVVCTQEIASLRIHISHIRWLLSLPVFTYTRKKGDPNYIITQNIIRMYSTSSESNQAGFENFSLNFLCY